MCLKLRHGQLQRFSAKETFFQIGRSIKMDSKFNGKTGHISETVRNTASRLWA